MNLSAVAYGSNDAPRPEKNNHRLTKHGDVRVDPYYWLNDRSNPKVSEYLNAENAYFESVMNPLKSLESQLFKEMKSRIKEDASSAPYKDGDYFYYARYVTGSQYPIYCRKKGNLTAPEEILLDINEMAKTHSYYQVLTVLVSPDHKLLGFAVDDTGRRFHTIYFKDLTSGKLLNSSIKDVTGEFVWAADNQTVFFVKQNPDTLRADQIFRQNIFDDQARLVFNEEDETYSVSVYKSLTEKFIFIGSRSTLTTEVRFLPADQPTGDFQVFLKRKRGHEYVVEDGHDGFYVLSNEKAKNFKVMRVPFDQLAKRNWAEIVPHRKTVFIDEILVFRNQLALLERKDGLTRIRVLDKKTKKSQELSFDDEAYMVTFGQNVDYESPSLRYEYESPRMPETVYDYNLSTKKTMVVKSKDVPNFDPDLYRVDRVWVPSRDGKKIPVTLLMKRNQKADKKNPMLIYGYGSYGFSIDPGYSQEVFSLVDRGFVYAVAHIRGGGELGRWWTDEGRGLKKMNTFFDFIDSTEYLIKRGYADPSQVFAMGGSAGGLLMGAITNLRPDLYRGIVAQVPFVDVLTTILDPSIPLTTSEYDEWGNPNVKSYYSYMKKYSPYDNIRSQAYPSILVTTGLHDSQVQYWEPAKWVAKLRDLKTNNTQVLLHTDMSSGHGGKSGRFDSIQETVEEYAFILGLIEKKIN